MLAETADLMEIAGEDPFRIRSYRNAASAIESWPERVVDLLADPVRKVTEIPGIGKGMQSALVEIAARGSFERRDELLTRYPPTALELLRIQGLGPKSIALLWEHYRVSTIDDLEKICQEQKLRTLPRMGAKLEEKVLRSIASYRRRAGRFLLNFADEVAAELTDYLAGTSGVESVTRAGSLRRGRETVGRSRPAGHGRGAGGGARPLPRASSRSRSAGPRREQGQRESGPAGDPGGRARAPQGELRRRTAILHWQQRAQRGAAQPRSQDGSYPQRVRPVPSGGQRTRRRLHRRGGLLRVSAWHGFRRSCAKTAARSSAPPRGGCRTWWNSPRSGATCTCTPPKPMAAPRSKRWPPPRVSSATSTLPLPIIPRRSRWPTAWTKRARLRSRDAFGKSTPAAASAYASSPASSATYAATALWTWPTTPLPNSTS